MPRPKKAKRAKRRWEEFDAESHVPRSWCTMTGVASDRKNKDMEDLLRNLLDDTIDPNIDDIVIQNPEEFVSGGVNTRSEEKRLFWERILMASTTKQATLLRRWLEHGPTVEEFANTYHNGTKLPPRTHLKNGILDLPLQNFARKKLKEEINQGIRIQIGERSKITEEDMPHIISPTGVVNDQSKMRKYDNCTFLNQWCKPPQFHLPYIQQLTSWVSKFFTVIDFKSCFMNILIHPESRKFFGTQGKLPGDDKEYIFVATTLVFRWNCSPYIEQTIVEAIVRYIRMCQIEICTFYDDSACGEIQDSPLPKTLQKAHRDAKRAVAIVIIVFAKTGFFIALSKGCFIPNTSITYLGAIIDFEEGSFRIHPDKQEKFLKLANWILLQIRTNTKFNVDILESFTGKCNYFCFCIQGGHAILRSSYLKIAEAKGQKTRGSPPVLIVMGDEAASDIIEWISIMSEYEVKSFWIQPNHKVLTFTQTSDANQNRWGAALLQTPLSSLLPGVVWKAGAEFNDSEHSKNIGVKEAIALRRGLELSIKNIKNITIDIQIDHKELWEEVKDFADKPIFDLGCDNMGVYLAALKGSSRNIDVNKELKDMFAIARRNNVRLQFFWLDTKANHVSDAITREAEENDFVLSQYLFDIVNTRFGPFTVDAMASNHNSKCKTFFSRYDCPGSSFTNVLAWVASEQEQNNDNFYVYPPFSMARIVLQHMQNQKVNFTIVAAKQLRKLRSGGKGDG
ncbi:hypothetical protein BDR26DRAFT_958090 [Obelidium mucronatum]|nr:hypothetical protein BDR26DRAFT_958090 [Obelidium mucronatum]